MSLLLELPAALEAELTAESERLGVSVSEVVAKRIVATPHTGVPHPKTGAELVSYWRMHGIIGSRTDITDSVAFARSLRSEAETRLHE